MVAVHVVVSILLYRSGRSKPSDRRHHRPSQLKTMTLARPSLVTTRLLPFFLNSHFLYPDPKFCALLIAANLVNYAPDPDFN
ncbi:hypothetical protein BJ170DRAFT_632708 [Xylariales sp. AK1849]|nr:hypothetical protein BJ170DRAFT_632708 [Xylariales sp. AK1849]